MNILLFLNFLLILSFVVAFFKKICNAGNVVGLIFFSITFFVLLFREKLFDLLIKSQINAVTVAVLFFILFLVFSPLFVFSVVMTVKMLFYSFVPMKKINFSDTNEVKSYKFVIVPGCKVKGNKPSKMLMQRIDAAYMEYLKAPERTFIIASGGKGDDEIISEAECICNELVKLGADKYRIYKEDKSATTYENMKNSYCRAVSALHSKEMYGRPSDNYYMDIYYVIATNGFHMYRSIKLAEACGFKAYAAVAHTTFWLIPTYWIRELMALFKYYIVKRIR